MSPGDCLIWVGSDYYRTVHRFVSEAATRGCCRRVPAWPAWAEAGQTRVFLAHRDRHDRTDRGSVFGYFTLAAVGIVVDEAKIRAAPPAKLEPFVDFCRRNPAGKPRPVPLPEGPPYDGDVVDFIVDLLLGCENDDGYGISTDQGDLEEDRLCGDRSTHGALYFVDDLAREIDEALCELLKELLKDDRRPRRRRRSHFDEVVEQARSTLREETTVPKELADIAEPRGRLVVFKRPYPTYGHIPQAFFRGLLRVEGDELLRQIVASYRETQEPRPRGTPTIELPYYLASVEPGGKKTKRRLVTDLADERQATTDHVRDFWGSFAEMIERELRERERITFTGVGTFLVKESRGAKQIKFKPSDSLKERVRGTRPPSRRQARRWRSGASAP
jgi:nucleoid DNA-binding protein